MNHVSCISLQMLELMRDLAASTPPGNFAEVGVYRGGSAAYLQGVASNQGRKLYLFDTFAGIPVVSIHDRHHKIGDFGDTDVERVRAMVPLAEIVVGVFPDSLVETGPLAFVHADADQYDSTRAICTHLGPRMVEGGLMLFDDYCLDGCRLAVDECFPQRDILPDGRALVRF